MTTRWYRVAASNEISVGEVTTVTAGTRAVCLVHSAQHGLTAFDNHCPDQGGPLGEGQLDGPWLICPWHGFEYDPKTGDPPEGYGDCATALPLEVRDDGVFVEVDEPEHVTTISDQMVDVMTDWGANLCSLASRALRRAVDMQTWLGQTIRSD